MLLHCFLLLLYFIHLCDGFSPVFQKVFLRQQLSRNAAKITQPSMRLSLHEQVIVVGVAADSGCGKSTFMHRLTEAFGGKVCPLGGGFGTPGTM